MKERLNNRDGAHPFRFDGGFYVYTGKLFDLVVLSLLWTLCSVPLFTVGASNCALYAAVTECVCGERGSAALFFLKKWKENFRTALLPGIATVLLFLFLLFDIGIVREQEPSPGYLFLLMLFVFCLAALIALCCFLFPVLALYRMPVRWHIKTALFLAVKHLPLSLMLVVLFVLLYVLLLKFPLLLLIVPGGFALAASWILAPALKELQTGKTSRKTSDDKNPE